MAELIVNKLNRSYGSAVAVRDVCLHVREGEFVTLLGPSGCGKSTTLSMIAGLERPDSGSISVGGETFFDGANGRFVEAEKRNLGLVFQSYALWPHMTVGENVGYALKLRRVPKAERSRKVAEALALVEMDQFINRYPNQMSGGQQQRVALARTLAYRPKLLLLDEPLSNLDAKLREKARVWLKQLQDSLGITTIFVTHDQSEALALSDKIAVMNGGAIVQYGSPREIYEKPADPFVADFIGGSNFLSGTVQAVGEGNVTIAVGDGQVLVGSTTHRHAVGAPVRVICRPEKITTRENCRLPEEEVNVLRARIVDQSYLGSRTMISVQVGSNVFRMDTDAGIEGDTATVCLPKVNCVVVA